MRQQGIGQERLLTAQGVVFRAEVQRPAATQGCRQNAFIRMQQPRRVVQVQANHGRYQQELGVGCDQLLLSFFLNRDFRPPRSATPPTATTFHILARKMAAAAQNPFFVAMTAAPPVISAARPNSATWSPARNSE